MDTRHHKQQKDSLSLVYVFKTSQVSALRHKGLRCDNKIDCLPVLNDNSVNKVSVTDKGIVRSLHKVKCPSVCFTSESTKSISINALNTELNPICYLLALLAHHFLQISRIRVKSLTLRRLMSYIYGAPILDVSRLHTTTQHSR